MDADEPNSYENSAPKVWAKVPSRAALERLSGNTPTGTPTCSTGATAPSPTPCRGKSSRGERLVSRFEFWSQVQLHTRVGRARIAAGESMPVALRPVACATGVVHGDGSQLGSRREIPAHTPHSGSGRFLMCLTVEMRPPKGRWFEPSERERRDDWRHDHG